MLNLAAAAMLAVSPAPDAAPPPVLGTEASPAPEQPPQAAEPAPAQDPAAQADPARQPDAGPPAPSRDILVTGRRTAGDPLVGLNVKGYEATQAVDRAFTGPAAMAYARAVPSPVRRGIHDFLYNLREPVIFVNFLAQHKIGKAAETFARFAVNSTLGVAGVLDVAKRRPFRLPRRANGFADTLGFYGVGNGPFLFLPITGPTTVRDLIGGAVDRLLLPVAVGKPFTSTAFTAPLGVLGVLDHRADFDPTVRKLRDGVADPYAASRGFYLSRRQAEIDHLRGRGPGNATPVGEAPVDSTEPLKAPAKREGGKPK